MLLHAAIYKVFENYNEPVPPDLADKLKRFIKARRLARSD